MLTWVHTQTQTHDMNTRYHEILAILRKSNCLQLCALRWVLLQSEITQANDTFVEMTRHWKWHNRRTYCRNWFSCLGTWGITCLHLFLATGSLAQSCVCMNHLQHYSRHSRIHKQTSSLKVQTLTPPCFRKASRSSKNLWKDTEKKSVKLQEEV